jgi:hypothetical protein
VLRGHRSRNMGSPGAPKAALPDVVRISHNGLGTQETTFSVQLAVNKAANRRKRILFDNYEIYVIIVMYFT